MAEQPIIYGLMAEFAHPDEVLSAAQRTRDAGYSRAEAYVPFPVHGLPEILHPGHTRVPAIVFGCGIMGAILGFGLCWYANVISFPWNVGGRPPNSWPAWIPITFELMVLCASLGAVLGMLGLNRLPEPYHPVFNAPNFSLASKNRFFLCIEAKDPKFNLAQTRSFLEGLRPLSVVEVPE
jgi:hypothetical protein